MTMCMNRKYTADTTYTYIRHVASFVGDGGQYHPKQFDNQKPKKGGLLSKILKILIRGGGGKQGYL